MVFIIAFHGKAASGKSAAAQYLVNKFGKNKVEIWDSFRVNTTPDVFKEILLKGHISPFVNTDITMSNIEVNKVTKPILVVSSINDRNEADYVRGMGGIVVHVFRPEHFGKPPITSNIPGDEIDIWIKNDQNLTTYLDRVHDNLYGVITRKLGF